MQNVSFRFKLVIIFNLIVLPASWAQTIQLANDKLLEGEPVELRIEGLRPGQTVRLTAKRAQGYLKWKRQFSSTAVFEADDNGQVELHTDQPKVAEWDGVDPAGLFWTMKPNGKPADESQSNSLVLISADYDDDGSNDAKIEFQLLRGRTDLVESKLDDKHPGAFVLRPAGNDPLPTIVLLGGSGGHDWSIRQTAPMLASRGFAVVGVPYFSPQMFGGSPPVFPQLPRHYNHIPVDRLISIVERIRDRPDLDSDRLGLHGVSKGAEMALVAASRMDDFNAVVAITPADVVWEGFEGVGRAARPSGGSSYTWNGKPISYVPMKALEQSIKAHDLKAPLLLSKATRKAITDSPEVFANAKIPVERINCPVFLVGGGSDEVSDCGYAAKRIKASRDKERNLETYLYFSEKATHSVSGSNYAPSSEADAQLKAKAFPAMLEFLRRELE